MNEQLDLIGTPSDMTGQPRVWTLDELEPIVRATWPAAEPTRARCHDVMMVLEGYFPARVTEPEAARILLAYAVQTQTGGGPHA